MSVFKKGKKGIYHFDFWYLGQHVQGSTRTTRKTLALEVEKQRRLSLERAYAGLPAEDPKQRVRTVQACIAAYVANLHCSASTETWTKERLAHVERLIGGVLLPVSEEAIKAYMRTRAKEGAGPRTQNMELDLLARAIGHSWKALWPKVKRNKEPKDTGVAFSPDEEVRLLREAARVRSHDFEIYVRLMLLAPIRADKEAARMKWKDVHFRDRYLIVAESKTAAGEGRCVHRSSGSGASVSEPKPARWGLGQRFRSAALSEHARVVPAGRHSIHARRWESKRPKLSTVRAWKHQINGSL